MVKKEFIETSGRNWKYAYTDLIDTNDIVDTTPPNAVASLMLVSKYSSVERGGWTSHTERVFLNNDGTFTSDGYDRILSRILPIWLMMVSIISQDD